MISEAVRSVLGREGSAAWVTSGPNGPHLVATWHSYIRVLDDHTLAFPAGGDFPWCRAAVVLHVTNVEKVLG